MTSSDFPRVLIVDDSLEIAICFSRMLERAGIPARYVTNGLEALALYEASRAAGQPFAVVLLDWSMPIMNGLQVAQEIRETDDAVQIAFLTAFYEDVELKRAKEVSAEMWSKPIDSQTLCSNVRRLLEALPASPS